MRTIEVDIDLDEFDNEELIYELNYRTLSPDDIESLSELIKDKVKVVEINSVLPTATLNDQLKLEHLIKVWSNYSVEQFYRLLPE